jgi:dihydrofolate reductase
MPEAYRAAGDAPEVAIIGGSAIFAETLPDADTIYLTEVDAEVEGDVFFPPFDRSRFRETELERHAGGRAPRLPLQDPQARAEVSQRPRSRGSMRRDVRPTTMPCRSIITERIAV